jgi:23S rRNA (pseudouridine1915-N3)-methyltransferase
MRIVILAVGSPRDRALARATRAYESRLARYLSLEAIETPRGGRGDVDRIRREEGRELLKRIPDRMRTYALTRAGRAMSSRGLAEVPSRMASYGMPGAAFLIGGAFGLEDEVLARADELLSLSEMTLPHELARLVLAEQLYRAGTILRGEPYHKGV